VSACTTERKIVVRSLLDPSLPEMRGMSDNEWFYEGFEETYGTVYLITAKEDSGDGLINVGDYVKIGWTKAQSAAARVKDLQTGNPLKLEVAAEFIAADSRLETELHELFAVERCVGEWFKASNSFVYWFNRVWDTNEARLDWSAEDRLNHSLGGQRDWHVETDVEHAIEMGVQGLEQRVSAALELAFEDHPWAKLSMVEVVTANLNERKASLSPAHQAEADHRPTTVWASTKDSHTVLPFYVVEGMTDFEYSWTLEERLLHCLSAVCVPTCRAHTERQESGGLGISVVHSVGCLVAGT
jgi:hypothetical protein